MAASAQWTAGEIRAAVREKGARYARLTRDAALDPSLRERVEQERLLAAPVAAAARVAPVGSGPSAPAAQAGAGT